MNIAEAESIISQMATPELLCEMKERISIRAESSDEPDYEPMTLLEAFEDLADRDESNGELTGKHGRLIRSIQISIGQAVEFTDEEARRTISNGKAWWFRLGGKRYRFGAHPA